MSWQNSITKLSVGLNLKTLPEEQISCRHLSFNILDGRSPLTLNESIDIEFTFHLKHTKSNTEAS